MTRTAASDDWRTQHLFLLIGGNPLPNYVAGKLLLNPGGTLHLVHSPDTLEMAERIGQRIGKYVRHQIQNPANSAEIEYILNCALTACKGETVGLNYTGGTKAMAVHAFQKIAGAFPNAILTYLDAHTLSLYRVGVAAPRPVQYLVRPKLEDLFSLHGIELARPFRRQPRRERLNEALARAHQNPAGQEAYETWCQRYLRWPDKWYSRSRRALDQLQDVISNQSAPLSEDAHREALWLLRGTPCCRGELVKERKEFAKLPIPFPIDSSLSEVADAMREVFGVAGDAFDPTEVIKNPEVGLEDIEDLVHYLDGDWVEHLALAAFQTCASDRNLHDFGMSIRTKKSSYDFEFDVAALQGYQLYAVSCTRSAERGLCKSKLFEAYVRAAQLGGDEAKVGLVCCDKSPQQLQQQVREQWRAEPGRICVFGPQDIAHLPDRFADWLSGRCRDQQ